MSEWKNLREEFPTDKNKLYQVKATRDGFTINYLCKLFDLSGTIELTGYSPFGRRFGFYKPKNREPAQTLDLLSMTEDRPTIMWREIDAD
jgi:hypothetical protein